MNIYQFEDFIDTTKEEQSKLLDDHADINGVIDRIDKRIEYHCLSLVVDASSNRLARLYPAEANNLSPVELEADIHKIIRDGGYGLKYDGNAHYFIKHNHEFDTVIELFRDVEAYQDLDLSDTKLKGMLRLIFEYEVHRILFDLDEDNINNTQAHRDLYSHYFTNLSNQSVVIKTGGNMPQVKALQTLIGVLEKIGPGVFSAVVGYTSGDHKILTPRGDKVLVEHRSRVHLSTIAPTIEVLNSEIKKYSLNVIGHRSIDSITFMFSNIPTVGHCQG